jgi:hypothetical protein
MERLAAFRASARSVDSSCPREAGCPLHPNTLPTSQVRSNSGGSAGKSRITRNGATPRQRTRTSSRSWSFLGLELWAPTWTVCERENLAPDVFVSVGNESLSGGYGQDLLFNPVVVFAVVSELVRRRPTEVSAVSSSLRDPTSARLVGLKKRPWASPKDRWASPIRSRICAISVCSRLVRDTKASSPLIYSPGRGTLGTLKGVP